ncbi:MAG TPA: hypothetical protein VHZ53_06110 [Steroidobacteraceae bacterium]|jgi:hypothetical protein|nr:hypothetical protein [Steroidobacteraceae bacterium]
MNELRRALAEIHTIRNQVARGTEFRGYGPASIAASGVLALMVAGLQAEWAVRHPRLDLSDWLAVWVATAALVVVVTGVETFRRARRVHRGLALEMVQSAVEQFLPALTVGVLLTVVMVRMAPAEYWMLPGLWELVFSLGVFASCRFLPRPMIAVGVWYLAAGLYCLAAASQSHGLSPWMMGIPFGVGQLLVAVVLQRRYGQTREPGLGDAHE